MSRLRVNAFGVSIDGHGAGPDQDQANPPRRLDHGPQHVLLLGRGEPLLAGIDLVSLGYKCTEHAATDHATHVVLTK